MGRGTIREVYALDDPNAVMPGSEVPRSGLTVSPARCLDDVLGAWRLVYYNYAAAGRIARNSLELYSLPEAIGPHATVLTGRLDGLIATTLTVIGDSPAGLPLDHRFATTLNAWRRAGRRLVAADLFGDRRHHSTRCSSAIYELLHHAFFLALHDNATDLLCAVPAQHVPLYRGHFGFEAVDETDPARCLMRATVAGALDVPIERSAFAHFLKDPVPAEAFAQRFDFDPAVVAASPLGQWMRQQAL